jgi:sterol desaturase/sphingolipid hydroxylase (fatty acid hydroxylase superfamily)
LQAAALAHGRRSFGDATTLASVAAQFFRYRCSQLLLVLVVAGLAARLAVAQWTAWDLLLVAGVLGFWPLQEWLVHVLILHSKPVTIFGKSFEPIIARNHRNHHRDPWHPELGITPPHIIWLYLTGMPGLGLLLLPAPQALTVAVCFFSLVLNYEWIHFLIHTSYVPRSRFYRRLWRNHRLHHFKNEHYWFGVTMLSGDQLLQTQPPAGETARSETCLNLGVERELLAWSNDASR